MDNKKIQSVLSTSIIVLKEAYTTNSVGIKDVKIQRALGQIESLYILVREEGN